VAVTWTLEGPTILGLRKREAKRADHRGECQMQGQRMERSVTVRTVREVKVGGTVHDGGKGT